MSVQVTVIDDRADPGAWYQISRYTGPMAAATRIGEVSMTSAATMVSAVIRAAGGEKIHWLNVLDHGNARGIQLGSDWVNASNVQSYAATLSPLRNHFTSNATVHLQHCEAGQNDRLMKALSGIWGGVKIRAGHGLHNPVYRVNFSLKPYRICNATTCWDERKAPPQPIDWTRKMCCFAAGTRVWSPDGPTPIENLRRGARVYGFDPATGRPSVARVAGLDTHEGSFQLRKLHSAAGEVEVTDDHFFATDGGQWRPSVAVEDGSALASLDRRQRVCSARADGTESRVFNVRVEGLGSYYVGDAALLARDH